MMGLLADGWFYISSAGLLISGVLFFFLLGQYRVASEAADATEGEQSVENSAPAAIRPVYVPDEPAVAKVASHPVAEAASVPAPEPKAEAPNKNPERRVDPANTTGGISPAVVYLQNIKVQMAELHDDLRSLAKRVDDEITSVAARDEALIERLGELSRAVESLKSGAAVPAETEPAPKKTRKPEKTPERAVDVVVEAPQPSASEAPAAETVPPPAPAPSPEETIRMDLGALVAPPAAEPASPEPAASQEPAATEPPPEEKTRRGPVWPV